MERLGRKMLFLLSESLTCLSVVALGGYFYVLENDPATAQRFGWVPMTLLITFIAVFAAGVGPLPWLVAGEVMPAKFKGPGSSIVAFTNWITSFIVTKVFIDMQRSLTNAGTFWVFGSLCFVGILFGIFILPETKGKTPEQIQALFATDVSEPPTKSGVNINSTTTSSVDQPSHFWIGGWHILVLNYTIIPATPQPPNKTIQRNYRWLKKNKKYHIHSRRSIFVIKYYVYTPAVLLKMKKKKNRIFHALWIFESRARSGDCTLLYTVGITPFNG